MNRPVLQSSDRIRILNRGEAAFPLLRFLRISSRSSNPCLMLKVWGGVRRFSPSRKR